MLFYLIGFTIITMLILLKGQKKINIIIVFALFILVYGCRNYGGVDDFTYITAFNNAVNKQVVYGMENSFILISQILGDFGFNYKSIFMFYSLISFIFIYLSYSNLCKNKYDWLVAIIGFITFLFIPTITLMRQFLAASIVMYSIILTFKNKYKKALIYIFIASIFHKSAIISFLIIPIFGTKLKNSTKLLLPIISLIIGYSGILNNIMSKLIYLIPNKYVGYISIQNGKPDIGLLNIILIIIYILQFILPKISKVRYSQNNHIDFLEKCEMINFCLYFMTLSSEWINRISIYFRLFTPFIFITFIDRFDKIKDKKILYIICYVAYILLFIYQLINLPNSLNSNLIPYSGSLDFIK